MVSAERKTRPKEKSIVEVEESNAARRNAMETDAS
jgi:hypothetical protein